ncbi:shikimate kinase [Paenibacillus oceani]|uniref:Shikimate kinase n=1 Tax=Paenibacillus oceani TaxID=2772510 RepID=A0A927H2Q5_9BACL|nr:shikimate kinase [Paenibacillus oceani]MBD2864709.1 shikimate kinase [Paenibacillus oceani]
MSGIRNKSNIALIGMPACGKSTIGVIVAEALNRPFIDTDSIIQEINGKPLWRLLEDEGREQFLMLESDAVCSLSCANSVIATGGSVVYSEKAMEFLKSIADIVFMEISYPAVAKRLAHLDIQKRGVVMHNEKKLLELYEERDRLYRKYADYTVAADERTVEELAARLIDVIRKSTAEE